MTARAETMIRQFRTSREEARLRLYALNAVADVLMLTASFAFANLLLLGHLTGEPGKPHGLVMVAMIAPLYMLLVIKGGGYGIGTLTDPRSGWGRSLWALVQAAFVVLIFIYLAKLGAQLSRRTFVAGLMISAVGLGVVRGALRPVGMAVVGEIPHLTVLIDDGTGVDPPRDAVLLNADALGIDPLRHDAQAAERLAAAVRHAERVVVACASERIDGWRLMLASLSARAEILLPETRHLAPVTAGTFEHHPTIVVAGGPLQFRDRIIKRLFDIMASVVGILCFAPVLILAAAAVRLSGPGPVLFRQERIGRDGRPFTILKFRTMHHALRDSTAVTLTQRQDPRISPIGRLLRKTSVDELPQIFNVLAGDMSVVGPRPHAAEAKAAGALYWEVDSRYWARHCIKPGMTGLAQVRGHRGPTDREEDLVNRLQCDLEYVTNWSILRDFRIIVATLGVIAHENAF